VDTHVRRLRRKLGGAADAIETVVGVGYRFRD
jgi:DNA-binding response OmpR family regulator